MEIFRTMNDKRELKNPTEKKYSYTKNAKIGQF